MQSKKKARQKPIKTIFKGMHCFLFTFIQVECSCVDGYQLNEDGLTCSMINECELGVDFCNSDSDCIKLPVGYFCQCHAGYVLDPTNDKLCIDMDECTVGEDLCQHSCVNLAGSYRSVKTSMVYFSTTYFFGERH